MLKIGITGGIGSGKTIVSRIFAVLGVPVLNADTLARSIMNEDEALKASIITHFGAGSYTDGILNRSYISGIVFQNKERLAQLNALIHPATIRAAEQWMLLQDAPYVIKEAALIFESGSQQGLDYIIGVQAPKPLRIQRAMHRDNINRDEVLKRMKNQIDEEIKMRLCDFVIKNDEQVLLTPQVIELHEQLVQLSNKK